MRWIPSDHGDDLPRIKYVKEFELERLFIHLIVTTSKCVQILSNILILNPIKPEFTIVIFIHYKPRIAVAILYL